MNSPFSFSSLPNLYPGRSPSKFLTDHDEEHEIVIDSPTMMSSFIQPHPSWSSMLRPALFVNVRSTAPLRIRGQSLDHQERCLQAVATQLATVDDSADLLKFPFVSSTSDSYTILVTIDAPILIADRAAALRDQILKLSPIKIHDDSRDLITVLTFTSFDPPLERPPSALYQCEIGPLPSTIILDSIVDILVAMLHCEFVIGRQSQFATSRLTASFEMRQLSASEILLRNNSFISLLSSQSHVTMMVQILGSLNALGALAAGSDSAETLDQPQTIH